jgi:RNA polymerase sigma-70 factor (ECF subfamily)
MVSEIVERIRQKDQRAMSELYEMYVQELALVCRRYVADADDAKDVLQNSFIKIFVTIPTLDYRGEEAFRAWMCKVVVNEARVFLRDQKRHQTVQLATATVTTDDEDTTASSEEITPAQLHRLISELPIGYRTVLNLFVFGHYSHRQIAQLLGIKEVTSATQFYYAKQRLARRIRELALAFSAAASSSSRPKQGLRWMCI